MAMPRTTLLNENEIIEQLLELTKQINSPFIKSPDHFPKKEKFPSCWHCNTVVD